ncbi:MAG: hypothetical protein HQ553_16650 [Chloroflexi bacterium]|nr:hypothetical protein [Chloroflexota bacterium]
MLTQIKVIGVISLLLICFVMACDCGKDTTKSPNDTPTEIVVDSFVIEEIRDASTLDIDVIEDWHLDSFGGQTYQKLIEITVTEWWTGEIFRVPVRMVSPADGATGFVITGGTIDVDGDQVPGELEQALLGNAVGVVYTQVQSLNEYRPNLEAEMFGYFLEAGDMRYTPAWIWGMIEMRAITAVLEETEHFSPGKIGAFGYSKNGFAPAVALIQDDRVSAILAENAPAYVSPLRVFEPEAVAAIKSANEWFFGALESGEIDPGEHSSNWYSWNVYGTTGADLDDLARQAGWSDAEILWAAKEMWGEVIVSENWDQIMARNAKVLYIAGTHDWVLYDILWGAQNHPEVPILYEPNGGHSQIPHSQSPMIDQTREAFFMNHFFGGPPLLEPPASSWEIIGDELHVTVRFENGPQPETGRIFWIHDRYPGGSAPYLWEMIPEEQTLEMTFDPGGLAWTVAVPLDPEASTIEFFTNHGLNVGEDNVFHLSSRYTQVVLD